MIDDRGGYVPPHREAEALAAQPRVRFYDGKDRAGKPALRIAIRADARSVLDLAATDGHKAEYRAEYEAYVDERDAPHRQQEAFEAAVQAEVERRLAEMGDDDKPAPKRRGRPPKSDE